MCNDYILNLSAVTYIGFRKKYLLLKYFGSTEAIFKATYNDLYFSGIIKPTKVKKLSEHIINHNIKEKLKSLRIKTVSIFDNEYPTNLRNIYDPPILLYYIGELNFGSSVGIVGSRKCSPESAGDAFELSRNLSKKGYVIISGMARGIDTAAHRGALESGFTIAVLGNGVDICYPRENSSLKNVIEQKGCVISEYPPGTNPAKYTFPARNRIISGLSDSLVVAESGEKSGALITAEFALEQGRDVYVLSRYGKVSGKGTKMLHKEGADLIDANGKLSDGIVP